MSFTIDWDHIGSDGSQTFGQGTSDEVTVTVSTPKNSEGKQWFVENGMLKNWDVSKDSNADIRFDTPVEKVTFTLLDVDAIDEITIMTKDENGNAVPVEFEVTCNHAVNGATITGTSTTHAGPGMDDGSQDVTVTVPGPVSTLWIVLDDGPERSYSGSVAVSDIEFDVVSARDGTVEGTDGDDLIDTAYTGDPDGDMVDNNDAILAGDTGNDDLIVAKGGDDTVYAGEGDDEVYGGTGADLITGGKGNDVIFGDEQSHVSFDGTLDFNELNAGDLVDGLYADQGVRIYSADSNHPVMVFDTDNPTGGDHDLATNNLGNVLILSEDRDSNDPDDEAHGGTFVFEFDAPAHVESLDFLDVEERAWIKLYDADGNKIGQIDTAATSDNGQLHQPINIDGVSRMEVILQGSGAIDNLCYSLDTSDLNTGDTLFGGDGADELYGGVGNDSLNGGTGDDRLEGGDGDDRIFGNNGNDLQFGGDGNDVLGGADSGDDTYFGGDGDDMVEASTGDDTIYGDAGNDNLWASSDDDLVFGGTGDDSVYGGHGQDVVHGDAGNDTLSGGSDRDTVYGGAGDDIIEGDALYKDDKGAAGADELFGGDGNDTFIVPDAAAGDGDVVVGGNGPNQNTDHDTLDLRGAGTVSIDKTADATDAGAYKGTVTFADGSVLTFSQIEEILADHIETKPLAQDDTASVDEDGSVTIPVLNNDNDADGDTLEVIEATSPDGEVIINDDGTITFIPNPDFNGEATIDYTITDSSGNTDSAQVVVTVAPVNDAPVAVNDEAETDEDTPVVIDVLDNDTDVDGDTLTIVSATVPANQGTVEIVNGQLVFTPADDFTGEATITYTVSDGNGGTDTAEVAVTVNSVNDAPLAVEDVYSADEDNVEVIGNVLDNDDDPDGDPLTVAEVNGNPAGVGQPVEGDNGGLVTIAADGTVTFDPNGEFEELRPGESVQTSITYTVTDPDGSTATETVTITVDGINDAPEATDNAYVVDSSEGFGDVDANVLTDNTGDGVDSDPENTTLKVVAVGGAAAGVGSVVAGDNGGQFIINEDGTVDFNANGDFDNLPLGASAQTSVTYTIEDEDGGTDTATVTFTVGGINDGTVQGTSGDDVIVPGYVDADGDIVDGNDAILPGDTGNDDLIFGFEGDDSINAGDGDDEVFGGIGNDTIAGGDGDDTLMGNAGDDVISGEEGDDRAFGGEGNDVIDGGAGNDVLEGSEGEDVIDGGDGDDDIWGGLDNDTLFGGDGNDTVGGGAGDDVIDTSNPNLDALPDVGYPGLYPADTDPNDDRDTVFGGAGNDSIITGDDDDTIFAGSGDDTINAGFDDDVVEGGTGNDTIIGGEGNDEIKGEDGDDLIFGGLDNSAPDAINIPDDGSGPYGADLVPENNGDTIFGGDGNDTIYGKDDDDTLFGDAGDDFIDGGVDDDIIDGGTGDDVLIGGQGDDSILGGDGDDLITGGEGDDVLAGGFGSDTFFGGNGGDNVVGGEDPDDSDIDVLDLTGTNIDNIEYTDGDPESGVVTFQDGTTMTFAEIENVIPCFTPGTMIATPTGEKLVEDLREGDRIITRDNGIQEIAWTGRKVLDGKRLAKNPHLKPILIKAGSLGDGLPERDMLVSPNHRVLVASELTQLYFEEREVLAAAKHMTGARGIHSVDAMSTTYIHFMCERHEVVLSNGAWTESFQPGDYSLKGLGNSQRNEIFELFPELATQEGRESYQAARKMLKKHEAKLLMR